MDNSLKFEQFRKQYKEFYYNSYSLKEDEEAIYLEFEFEIPNLVVFHPKTKILKKHINKSARKAFKKLLMRILKINYSK